MKIVTLTDDKTLLELDNNEIGYRCESILKGEEAEKVNAMLKSMKAVVLKYFFKLGFLPCPSGYFELMNAISVYCLDPSLKDGSLKGLYVTIASIVGRDQNLVKRNLRTYISNIWKSPVKDKLFEHLNSEHLDLEQEITLNNFIRMLGDPLADYINGEDNFCKEFFQ